MHELEFRMRRTSAHARLCGLGTHGLGWKIQSKPSFFLLPARLHQASHTSLAVLPVPSQRVEGVRAGLTDTAALITVWLSAMEKPGLECIVHLEGPSPWLAAL